MLNPNAALITCGRWCSGCRGTKPGCKNPPGRNTQILYKSLVTQLRNEFNFKNARNLSILQPLQILRLFSQLRCSTDFTTADKLNKMFRIRYRMMIINNISFTRVPKALTEYTKELCGIQNLSRAQWRIILPYLQDDFPSIPFKFYLLLSKLSFALGFLTKRLCRDELHLCPFIFRRVFTHQLVRYKNSPSVIVSSWDKHINVSDLLNVFF